MVHTSSQVPTPQIFTYGTVSDPQSPSHDSSEKSVTSKGKPTPHKNLPNPVPNVPADSNSYPSLSDYSSSDSSESSDNEYYRQIQRAKDNKKKLRSKTSFYDPIKKCENVTSKVLTAV